MLLEQRGGNEQIYGCRINAPKNYERSNVLTVKKLIAIITRAVLLQRKPRDADVNYLAIDSQ